MCIHLFDTFDYFFTVQRLFQFLIDMQRLNRLLFADADNQINNTSHTLYYWQHKLSEAAIRNFFYFQAFKIWVMISKHLDKDTIWKQTQYW